MSGTVNEVPYLEDLVNAVKSGHSILFLGAGVNAPPPDNSPFAYPPRNDRLSEADWPKYWPTNEGLRKIREAHPSLVEYSSR